MEKIRVTNLSLSLADHLLLSDIQLDCPSGEPLIIIGESGSGKTLLTKLMVGLVPKNAHLIGSVFYKDNDMTRLSEKDCRLLRGPSIAYMTQNPMAMFNTFQKIKDHFIETIQSHEKVSKKDCLARALQNMKKMRLGHPEKALYSYPFELSGGMLQRIMMAIMLCLEPDTIILDEPTSALDAYNRDNIIKILKELSDKGKTLVLVTHDYDLARDLGGQMLVMYKGRIVERGQVSEVLDNPQHPYTKELVLGNPYERLVEKNA